MQKFSFNLNILGNMKLQETTIPKSHWKEITNDYHDSDDGYFKIDAWKTDDEQEEGSVIAAVDDDTAKVYYIDQLARYDDFAQKMIQERRDAVLAHATR